MVGVATRSRSFRWTDAVAAERPQIRRVELQRADVEGPVAILDPLAGPTAFLFGDGQHYVGRHPIAQRRAKRARHALRHGRRGGLRRVSYQRRSPPR